IPQVLYLPLLRKRRGYGGILPILELTSLRPVSTIFRLSPFLSHSCALFSTTSSPIAFIFMCLRTLSVATEGVPCFSLQLSIKHLLLLSGRSRRYRVQRRSSFFSKWAKSRSLVAREALRWRAREAAKQST